MYVVVVVVCCLLLFVVVVIVGSTGRWTPPTRSGHTRWRFTQHTCTTRFGGLDCRFVALRLRYVLVTVPVPVPAQPGYLHCTWPHLQILDLHGLVLVFLRSRLQDYITVTRCCPTPHVTHTERWIGSLRWFVPVDLRTYVPCRWLRYGLLVHIWVTGPGRPLITTLPPPDGLPVTGFTHTATVPGLRLPRGYRGTVGFCYVYRLPTGSHAATVTPRTPHTGRTHTRLHLVTGRLHGSTHTTHGCGYCHGSHLPLPFTAFTHGCRFHRITRTVTAHDATLRLPGRLPLHSSVTWLPDSPAQLQLVCLAGFPHTMAWVASSPRLDCHTHLTVLTAGHSHYHTIGLHIYHGFGYGYTVYHTPRFHTTRAAFTHLHTVTHGYTQFHTHTVTLRLVTLRLVLRSVGSHTPVPARIPHHGFPHHEFYGYTHGSHGLRCYVTFTDLVPAV